MDVKILNDLLYAVLIAVIPILSKFIVDYLQSKKDKVDLERDTEYFKNTESKAITLIQTVVDTVAQTYVDSLKNKGTFNKESQKEAFNKALTKTKELMDAEMMEFITTMYSDTDAWITIQIESYIKTTKTMKETSDDVSNKAIPVINVSNITESTSTES